VVFTLPHQLSQLALANKKILYNLLFRASAATLLKIAADPKHLGADIGLLDGTEAAATDNGPQLRFPRIFLAEK
jgi:hypothetical protein